METDFSLKDNASIQNRIMRDRAIETDPTDQRIREDLRVAGKILRGEAFHGARVFCQAGKTWHDPLIFMVGDAQFYPNDGRSLASALEDALARQSPDLIEVIDREVAQWVDMSTMQRPNSIQLLILARSALQKAQKDAKLRDELDGERFRVASELLEYIDGIDIIYNWKQKSLKEARSLIKEWEQEIMERPF